MAPTGDKENPEHRCRIVATEIKKDERQDLFAATPPLEAKRTLWPLSRQGVYVELPK